MSDDIVDIFSRKSIKSSGGKCLPPPPKPPRVKRPYQAYEVSQEGQWNLQATNPNGAVRLLPYPYLNEVLFIPGRHQIDLFYNVVGSKMVIMLWGKNLNQLIEPLHDRKLRAVHGFNKQLHLRPEENATIITEIETASLETYMSKWA